MARPWHPPHDIYDQRSHGAISFHVASLYPSLYRREEKNLIEGR